MVSALRNLRRAPPEPKVIEIPFFSRTPWLPTDMVDALNVDLPPSEPILASELSDYLHTKNVVMHQLNNVKFEDKKVLMAQVGSQQ